jgi:hypothetical protein
MPNVNDLESSDAFIANKTIGTACKVHPGYPSLLSLSDIQEDMSRFIFKTRQLGIQFSTCMVCEEAYHLLAFFRNKTTEAKKKVITQFTKTLGHLYRKTSWRLKKSQNISLQWENFGYRSRSYPEYGSNSNTLLASFKQDTSFNGHQYHRCPCFFNQHKMHHTSCYC